MKVKLNKCFTCKHRFLKITKITKTQLCNKQTKIFEIFHKEECHSLMTMRNLMLTEHHKNIIHIYRNIFMQTVCQGCYFSFSIHIYQYPEERYNSLTIFYGIAAKLEVETVLKEARLLFLTAFFPSPLVALSQVFEYIYS